MLRLNRENPNSPQTILKTNCANFNTTSKKCDGVMIGKKLNQWIDKSKVNKRCLVLDSKSCDYYNRCVKPII